MVWYFSPQNMAKELPYLPTYKNLPLLFEKIEKARVPDALTVRYLSDTFGLKSTNDRAMIPLLKKLGFLDASGKPTEEYARLKNKDFAKAAIAEGIKRGYAPLYEAYENAHELPSDQLKGLVAQVSGTEEGMTKVIAGTFNALVKLADFSKSVAPAPGNNGQQDELKVKKAAVQPSVQPPAQLPKFSPEFRFNIEIHLPANGTEDTYLNIFNALRKALG
ncbi:MAG: hypothetical protein A3J28_00755 [Acidobacteria bacterium RIFCSPLOWO2_12_FULL_60_22]|nr:MAG: hypothetical protein A3J28_00755 [Acidobacteria bacterium RIFCSPLOWO2_12_FULL_60_22]